MANYIVFACPKCGMIRYAREGQKTAKCLKCGYQIRMDPTGVRVLAKAKDARDAVELVKLYKAKLK
ncbi:DUF1922 domain-containing protein [Candidatus Bathyarchaeota archaeon]|nr:DUF1922 domain-containing protein [Candidatus Bathyarchaeota archaeon]